MGKKDAVKDAKDVVEDKDDEFEEDTRQLLQVELGDFVKVKQTLDESVVKALLTLDYTENHSWDNSKLILMVVACLFAMVAQFYPMPFPESRPLLGVCCGAYFAASTVLQFIVTYVEKDCIMITGPVVDADGKPVPLPERPEPADPNAPAPNKTRVGGELGLRICTNFPRFSYDYTVSVQQNLAENNSWTAAASAPPPPNITSMRFKIHDYFTEDGLFDDERFELNVMSVVKDYEAGEYYTDKAWANTQAGSKKTN